MTNRTRQSLNNRLGMAVMARAKKLFFISRSPEEALSFTTCGGSFWGAAGAVEGGVAVFAGDDVSVVW
eukprot:CAMPEP_0198289910 /NCGR_PEP_ID=MMETSP1449-20131203/7949_1 /TAXON_ID=420275 /ORGANISM="Attheya septentrionalis, Strain CCMP2084" /LENGTH=67 /DNA_ID=CAMNT_0043988315 /DNA_START=56 /DNA_END=256 /DNA_ORIENTATION=+